MNFVGQSSYAETSIQKSHINMMEQVLGAQIRWNIINSHRDTLSSATKDSDNFKVKFAFRALCPTMQKFLDVAVVAKLSAVAVFRVGSIKST